MTLTSKVTVLIYCHFILLLIGGSEVRTLRLVMTGNPEGVKGLVEVHLITLHRGGDGQRCIDSGVPGEITHY